MLAPVESAGEPDNRLAGPSISLYPHGSGSQSLDRAVFPGNALFSDGKFYFEIEVEDAILRPYD
jgi:hypothetical protein